MKFSFNLNTGCVCIEGFSVPWWERQFSQYNYKFDIWSPNCIKFFYQSRHSIWLNAKNNFHVVFHAKWYMQVHVYSHDWRWIMQVRYSQVLCWSKNLALTAVNTWRDQRYDLPTSNDRSHFRNHQLKHFDMINRTRCVYYTVVWGLYAERCKELMAMWSVQCSLIWMRPVLCVCNEDYQCNWLKENLFRSTYMLPEM